MPWEEPERCCLAMLAAERPWGVPGLPRYVGYGCAQTNCVNVTAMHQVLAEADRCLLLELDCSSYTSAVSDAVINQPVPAGKNVVVAVRSSVPEVKRGVALLARGPEG